jgi:hypothetical protein
VFVTVPDKALNDLFTEAMWDTYIKDDLNTGVVRPIAEATLTGTAASIDITSIAASWSHLFVVLFARSDTAAGNSAPTLRFNGDAGANYDHQSVRGNANAASAAETFAATSARLGTIPANTAGANLFGGIGILIPHYAGANNKTFWSVCAHKQGTATGNLIMDVYSGFWRSNAAITQVTLFPGAGNFATGTRATLYGMGGI